MRIGVIHTEASPCGCAKAVETGLLALNHEVLVFASEEIELRAGEISGICDLVIDHTDTFCSSGALRPLVRMFLEINGARIVGSDARACFLADNKSAAKTALANAGIPVPPGITVNSKNQELPCWLKAPVVVKPIFEHMSRGLGVIEDDGAIYDMIGSLLERFQQPVLVEKFIPGREFAVSLLEEEDGVTMLPPLEWRMQRQSSILTEEYKHKDLTATEARQDVSRAEFPSGLGAALQTYSIQAFRALRLRDYARFDIRLSPGGTFYFLEANTTPSLEPAEAFAFSARWAGLSYPDLVGKMLSAALRRYGEYHSPEPVVVSLQLPCGAVNVLVPEKVHCPPSSTLELARLLDIRRGERVLEAGCGSGLLAVAAAKLGASVTATDIDPRALEATGKNALANKVAGQIEIVAGSWYESLGNRGKFDVIIATPPQTPGPYPFGSKYGGTDGTGHLNTIIQGAPRWLEPKGRLWLVVVSLGNPAQIMLRLQELFHTVEIVHRSERSFTGQEYEALAGGLMRYLLDLRSRGLSEFRDAGVDHYSFDNLCIRATGVKVP